MAPSIWRFFTQKNAKTFTGRAPGEEHGRGTPSDHSESIIEERNLCANVEVAIVRRGRGKISPKKFVIEWKKGRKMKGRRFERESREYGGAYCKEIASNGWY